MARPPARRPDPFRLLGGAVLLGGACLPGQAQGQPVERAGAHFTVRLQGSTLADALAGRLADEALAAAEGAWPAAERLLLLAAGKPAVVHVHGVESTFREIEREATGVEKRRDLVVKPGEQEAHVLLWPPLAAADLERVGLPADTRTNVVLAAASLLAAQKSAAAAQDPWLAGVFAYAVLEGKQAQPAKYGLDLRFDSRRWHHWAASEPKSLHHWVTLTKPPADRQAREEAEEGMCLIAQLLASGGGDWARRWLLPGAPGDSVAKARVAAVERVLGKDWAKIQARWQKQLGEIRVPLHVQSPMVGLAGKRLVLVGTPEHTATVRGGDSVPAGPYRVRATFELAPGDEDGVRLQLDWDTKSLVGLFFRAGEVELADWTPAQNWALIAKEKAQIAPSRPFDVVVEVGVAPGELRVLVDGAQVLRWNHGSRGMRGDWSLAKNHFPVFVEGLKVEAGAKR